MQIVIEIDEEEYQTYINHTEAILDSSIPLVHQDLLRAVINGTQLPKGHGDLIDRSKLVPDCKELEIHDGDDLRNEYCGVSLMQIEQYAEVIVKADGGDAE